MNRIDLTRLRKRAGMSQRELAALLDVRPSFLSAIENGRSRLPEEKIAKIKEIFEIDKLDEYMVEDSRESTVPPHTHATDESETISALLSHFHDLAHQKSRGTSAEDESARERIEYLTKRNERLSDRVDDLRDEVDRLRAENLALKEALLKAGIAY